jgi:hypothetical protein
LLHFWKPLVLFRVINALFWSILLSVCLKAAYQCTNSLKPSHIGVREKRMASTNPYTATSCFNRRSRTSLKSVSGVSVPMRRDCWSSEGTDCELDDPGSIPDRTGYFSFLSRVQTGSVAHPASFQNWQLTTIYGWC